VFEAEVCSPNSRSIEPLVYPLSIALKRLSIRWSGSHLPIVKRTSTARE
jgi:hypothetical protein